jgi:hypothetical protein
VKGRRQVTETCDRDQLCFALWKLLRSLSTTQPDKFVVGCELRVALYCNGVLTGPSTKAYKPAVSETFALHLTISVTFLFFLLS